MAKRTPRDFININREKVKNEEEFESLLKRSKILPQQDIDTYLINKTLCVNNDAIQQKIPTVNKLMTVFGILIGILMFLRGLIDGGLSMIGLWLRLIFFSMLSLSYGLDNRLEADRWSFLTPALSGLLLTVAQLIGMFIIDGPFECDSFSNCL